jgi:LDH2 family malate/lactate/ureidoglycolate dehydrogenase
LDAEEVCNKGDVFVCIDQTVVTGGPRSDEVSKYLNDVRSTPAVAGSAGVRIPGERAASERARRMTSGVEVALASWRAAVDLAGGVDASGMNFDPLGSVADRDQSPGSREMS